MPAPNETHPHVRIPGRVSPDPAEHIPTDKHGRTLQTQHDPSPDWGRDLEDRLAEKRRATRTGRLA